MLILFVIIAFFFFTIGLYLLKLGEFSTMSTMFTIAFISLVIGNLSNLRKVVKKFNINNNGLGIEFKNEEQKKFVDVAVELLENNFPILSNVGQKEVNKRVSVWIKDFLSEVEKQKIPVGDTKLFYDPDFQYVLNKAIETVGRRNDALINKALIHFLIDRIKYNDSGREDLIMQIDYTITNDIPRLTENHYKLMCLVKFLVELKNIFPKIETIDEFNNKIIKGLKIFDFPDARVYEDLKKTSFVHCGGNPYLMHPKKEDRETVQNINYDNKIPRLQTFCTDLFTYLKILYPFLNNISDEEKESIINNDFFKHMSITYSRIIVMVLLLPFADGLIYDYMMQKMNETFNNEEDK